MINLIFMEATEIDNNLIKNNIEKAEEFKEYKDIEYNSIKKNNNKIDLDLNNGQDENYNLCYIAKRSYSCKINESTNKNFPNNDDIKLNLNHKFMYLKTPQIKPKKSKLIPKPINIGSISNSKKKLRFNEINKDINIVNDIISEGENEESIEFSIDSSSDFTDGEEIKENNENKIDKDFDNEKEAKENDLIAKRLKSEKQKFELDEGYKIKEENDDDFDEFGKISVKNLRKGMIQSKKIFLKNDYDIINKIDRKMSQQEQYKKYKDDILKCNENISIEKKFHKTTGFSQAHHKSGCPILEFLKKNSCS